MNFIIVNGEKVACHVMLSGVPIAYYPIAMGAEGQQPNFPRGSVELQLSEPVVPVSESRVFDVEINGHIKKFNAKSLKGLIWQGDFVS
jgi:hypothetical protein